MEFFLHTYPDALRVLSKGDVNLANYARDPTRIPVTLSRARDAYCLFARDLALQSLREGKSDDTV